MPEVSEVRFRISVYESFFYFKFLPIALFLVSDSSFCRNCKAE